MNDLIALTIILSYRNILRSTHLISEKYSIYLLNIVSGNFQFYSISAPFYQ